MAMILRLDEDLEKSLAILSTITNRTKTSLLDEAVNDYIKKMVADPEIRFKLDRYITDLSVMVPLVQVNAPTT